MALKKHVSPHGTVMAVSMMKDEAPYLLEWFAHHMAVGFTDILVYTNDCSDGTDDMLIRLEELGLGYHRRNDIPEGIKPQPSALNYAQEEPLVGAADWVLVFDADEFLCIKHGDGTLDGMLSEAEEKGANGIVITWRIFGSGYVEDWSRDPVTEQYLYAAPPLWNKGWGVKTLFKFDPEYWKLGIHRPKIKTKHLKDGFPETVHWLNGSGAPMEDYFKFRGWRSIRRTLGYDWAQMNHYAVKGIDAYAIRKFRGNVNNKKDKYNADYWSLQDRNEVKDDSILRHAKRRAEIMAELLKDPVLNKLHFAALERVEARLNEYKQTEAYAEMKRGLIEAGKVPINKVVAKPPQARDPAKIAALMSEVEKTVSDKPKEERRNPVADGWHDDFLPPKVRLQDNPHVEVAANHAIMIPADAAVFGPDALDQIAAGKYARRHMRYITGQLQAGDRFLNIGGEAGVVVLQALKTVPDLVAMAQHSRPDIARVTEGLARRNDLMDSSRLRVTDGPLVFASDGQDEASGFLAYAKDFRPSVLRICDRDVTSGVLMKMTLDRLRRIILPMELFSEEGPQESYTEALVGLGFTLNEDWQDRGMLVFDRNRAP
ncbi:glycosyltransferase family 2 protein [Celeribacter persicus]|uniref:Glycosyl transferase family 2 n=1 Tax=Celeribacter persicus TaxID=1651082 RepID=A0A2T5HS37_9RHOB|nr:glycosyltransferase family 2 protein [Celeribacter persicus]PTQ74393.1 glycosyl transferase family 2 [Celeribacter persicus]